MIKLTDEEKRLVKAESTFLEKNDIRGFYRELNNAVTRWGYPNSILGHITQFFLENGIDVFNYVDTVYPCMFVGSDLESITIPDGVKRIQRSAFAGCENLRNIDLGNTVTTIDARAFYGCKNLRNLFLPDSVTTLGAEVFDGCGDITIVANKRTGANRLRCKQGEIPWYREHLFMKDDGSDSGEGGE